MDSNPIKVISFDVGIKNMAYCLFETPSGEGQRTVIKDWKVLSLLGKEEVKHKCSHITIKTAKKTTVETPCSHLAKYKQTECYLCDKHAKACANNNTWLLPEPRFRTVKKMKLEELQALAKEFGVDESGKKPEVLKNVENHLAKKCLIPVKHKSLSAGEADLISLGQAMKRVFKELLPEDISVVLIENQISPLASRMKTVQGMLAQYFIMQYENIRIEFISSANKLKMFSKGKKEEGPKEKEAKEESVEQTQSQKYKEHKKDGVFYCEQVLNEKTFLGGEQWTTCERKKKDDLADCFLQGVWWLKQSKNIDNK